jgi:DNA mismatch endonuclease (patch repair protein)
MTDVLSPGQRRLNMSRIKGKNTKPEMVVRRGLHARGLRYRLHDRTMPGRPDLVFPKSQTAVFVHGCFWHAHGCALSKAPATRPEFWQNKLTANALRDRVAIEALQMGGWRVLVIWECAIRGSARWNESELIDLAARYIQSGGETMLELKGCEYSDWKSSRGARAYCEM